MQSKGTAKDSARQTTNAARTSAASATSANTATPMTAAQAAQQGTAELTTFVQGLLQQMQSRFEEMSGNIISRIDDMSGRIDDLERCIGELMQQAGVEDGDAASPVASPATVTSGKK